MSSHLYGKGIFCFGKIFTVLYPDLHIMTFEKIRLLTWGFKAYHPMGCSDCNGHISRLRLRRSEESGTRVLVSLVSDILLKHRNFLGPQIGPWSHS